MKKITILTELMFVVSVCCFSQGTKLVVTATNSLKLYRQSETIAITWTEIKQLALIVEPGKIQVYDAKHDKKLVTQFIDIDQNGTADEMIFQSDFQPEETKTFIVETVKENQTAVQTLTDARFMVPREDVAWENDRIAFRMYGPALAKEVNNGFDVWVKRVRYPIIEKWYKGDEAAGAAKISYHVDHGEGADFFDVGRTLGDGSCALYKNDSLYQPGVFTKYKIISTGPIRAMFEVAYNSINYDGKMISEIKRISLDAGSNLNKIEVTYQCDSASGMIPFAAGIVKRKGVTTYSDAENRWVSLWGQTNKAEENGFLGTGIVMTKEAFKEIKENNVHVMTIGVTAIGKTVVYYAGAGWTRSGDLKTVEEWNNYLKEFSQRINTPLIVSSAIQK
jgi:hypothetical protein